MVEDITMYIKLTDNSAIIIRINVNVQTTYQVLNFVHPIYCVCPLIINGLVLAPYFTIIEGIITNRDAGDTRCNNQVMLREKIKFCIALRM